MEIDKAKEVLILNVVLLILSIFVAFFLEWIWHILLLIIYGFNDSPIKPIMFKKISSNIFIVTLLATYVIGICVYIVKKRELLGALPRTRDKLK